MRIVIDLQGLQTKASAHRGVGRYTENLVKSLLGQNQKHDFYLALQKINHRGPDSNQLISFDNNFFGHTRLSINDIEGGQQPIFNEDKSIVAIVNGEFYNFEEIREKLIKEGHNFSTQSDSEILIHLYEKYSIECLNYLHGEFAFSLYDKNKKR